MYPTIPDWPKSVNWLVATVIFQTACSSIDIDRSISDTNQRAASFTKGQLALVRSEDRRAEMDALAGEILNKPLSQSDAVRLALVNSPALQAMLAQNWADTSNAAQAGRIANPVFGFQRIRAADSLELERLLAFGLLDLLSLPQRQELAGLRVAQQQLRLTNEVIDQVSMVRQAWVKAVAAQQSLVYAKQINDAAQVSSELARRMQDAGNFNNLQRARQQMFYADAATQWTMAQHASVATREQLTRLLGLTEAQAQRLLLPDRLPDLPANPISAEAAGKSASKERLDVQLARSELDAQAKAQGLNLVASFTDIELGLRRDTAFDNAAGTSVPRRGYDVTLRLPIFDWGEHQRAAMSAQTLAAANRLEATVRAAGSNLRESYSAYRTAHEVSKHYRDEVVPLRKLIAEENLLRYNGMQIGVFELLADSRDQVRSVLAAIAAEQQFWLADAALQAAIIGKPVMTEVSAVAAVGSGNAAH